MLSRLFKWFRKQKQEGLKERLEQSRQSEPMETLTELESEWILQNSTCPDCYVGHLYEGPSGGLSTNVVCGFCHSKFNLTLGGPRGAFKAMSDRLRVGRVRGPKGENHGS